MKSAVKPPKPKSLFRQQDCLDEICDILVRNSRRHYLCFSMIIETDNFRAKYSQKAAAKGTGNKPRRVICLLDPEDPEDGEQVDDHDYDHDLEEVETPGTPPKPNPNPPPLTPPLPPPPPLTTPETPVGRDAPTPPQQLELGEIADVATRAELGEIGAVARALVIAYTPIDIVKF